MSDMKRRTSTKLDKNKHTMPDQLLPALETIQSTFDIRKINVGRSRGGVSVNPTKLSTIRIQQNTGNSYKAIGYGTGFVIDLYILTNDTIPVNSIWR